MKTLKKYVLGAALVSVAALTGCKDKMVELNTNPGQIGETNQTFMFYGATRNLFWDGRGAPATIAWFADFMQYSAYVGGGSRYTTVQSVVGGGGVGSPWSESMYSNEYYVRAGRDLQHMMNFIDEPATTPDREPYQEIYSIAKLIHTYLAWMQFDVYGAAVWKEAFKATQGITLPKYDLYTDVYKELDAVIKEHVAILNGPRPGSTVNLGDYDPFYGIKTVAVAGASGGGANYSSIDGPTARANWVRLGNTIRLKMAHRVNKVDNAHFEAVLAEVTNPANGGMMEAKDHGWFIRYPAEQGNDTDDGNQANYYHSSSVAIVHSLKVLEDPRLPLLVRPNGNTTQFADYAAAKSHARYSVFYDQWALRTYFPSLVASYGDLLAEDNFFIGLSNNPWAKAQTPDFTEADPAELQKRLLPGPGYGNPWSTVWLIIPNTNFANGPGGKNGPMLAEDGMTKVLNSRGQEITTESFEFDPLMISPFSGRYFLKDGGVSHSYDNVDFPKNTVGTLRLQRPILPYEEHCFRMALISLQNKAGAAVAGKTAEQWYQEGIRTAFAQIQEDALRSKVGIATAAGYPVIKSPQGVEYNPGGTPYDVVPYADAYIAAHPLGAGETALENIGVQAWIALYYQPEGAWAFWKQTGYPRLYDINPVQASAPLQYPAGPGLELPKSGEEGPMYIARRATLPPPQVENMANYNEAIQKLIATDGYGSHQGHNQGRIWWDSQNPDYVVDPTPVGY